MVDQIRPTFTIPTFQRSNVQTCDGSRISTKEVSRIPVS